MGISLLFELLVVLPGCGDRPPSERELRSSPQTRVEKTPPAGGGLTVDALVPEEKARLSKEQVEIVREFGWPQGFAIYQIKGEDNAPQRVEEWRYHGAEQTYVFANGRFLHDRHVLSLPRGFRPTPHRPSSFGPEMSVSDAERIPGAQELRSARALGKSYRLVAAPQLIAGFHDGRLTLVESNALVATEGEK